MSYVLFTWIIPTIHVLACLFLVVVVLLQTGKGADAGAVFGGGSQTFFGSGGAGNFLTKLTTGTAIAFMVTSLVLTYGQSREPSSRLLDRLPAPTAEEPAATGGLPPVAGTAPAAPAPQGDATANANAPAPTPAPAGQDAPNPQGPAAEQPAPVPAP
jgi:preprotein translocase subunit SecG